MGNICAWCGEREPVEGEHWCRRCLDWYNTYGGVHESAYTKHDEINAPPHYIFGPYEVTPILLEWLKKAKIGEPSAALWMQLMQYLFRFPFKGKPLRDLRKAEWYLKKLMEITSD